MNCTLISTIGIVLLASAVVVVVALLSITNNASSAQQTSSSSFVPFAQTNNPGNNSNTHTLYITGIATSKVKSDKVILSLGVQTTNKTANAALVTNSDRLNKVINAL